MAVPPGNSSRGTAGLVSVPDGTSQGPTPEDARKDGHIHGRSSRFMNNPGC
jgi:hypothetical protein